MKKISIEYFNSLLPFKLLLSRVSNRNYSVHESENNRGNTKEYRAQPEIKWKGSTLSKISTKLHENELNNDSDEDDRYEHKVIKNSSENIVFVSNAPAIKFIEDLAENKDIERESVVETRVSNKTKELRAFN